MKNTTQQSEHFDVRKSTIKGAGKGLFSRTAIKPGDTIGEYTGKVLTDRQVCRKPYIDSDYVLWVCKDHNILGEGPLANHTRYINHHEKPNARIVTSTRWKKARIEAIKRIRPDQEVFIDYGPDYWEAKAIHDLIKEHEES
ncbi:SET domain-containing protein-lysine N-methyltransferase [Pseudomonadota bacterium]